MTLPEAGRAVSILEQHDHLLERINLLEGKLRVRSNEAANLREALKGSKAESAHLRSAVGLLKTRNFTLEKQNRRAKRGRWIWGSIGLVVGVVVTALAVSLSGG